MHKAVMHGFQSICEGICGWLLEDGDQVEIADMRVETARYVGAPDVETGKGLAGG
jgi:hypothetical protein